MALHSHMPSSITSLPSTAFLAAAFLFPSSVYSFLRYAAMSSTYSYKPLSSARNTRILSLQPHTARNAPLRCTLEEISLDTWKDDGRSYDALSYVWGAKTGTRPLSCDNDTILITPNCESALRHIRHTKKAVLLWVDAIVINQTDLPERAQQVSLMANIYRGASEVIIWLGEGTTGTPRLFSSMKTLIKIMDYDWIERSFFHFPMRVQEKLLTLLCGNSLEEIEELFQNDWVTRIWTIQEQTLALSPTIMCGKSKVSWEVFTTFLGEPAVVIESMNRLWTLRMRIAKSYSVASSNSPKGNANFIRVCLLASHLTQSSDDLDKIYALYGLISKTVKSLPVIDYTKPKITLYEEFIKFTIQSTGKFWPASVYFWKITMESNVPSWIPYLASVPFEHDFVYTLDMAALILSEDQHPSASGDSSIILTPAQNPKPGSLALKGLSYAKILATSQRWPVSPTTYEEDILLIASWFAFCSNQKTPKQPYRDVSMALKEILLHGILSDGHYSNLSSTLDRILLWLSSSGTNPLPTNDPFSSKPLDKRWESTRIRSFISHIVFDLIDSVLFSTSTGHVGISVGQIEPGDTIALLAGADRPVVLRQQDCDWIVVGTLFVPGIMKGEAWPSVATPDTLDTFVLV